MKGLTSNINGIIIIAIRTQIILKVYSLSQVRNNGLEFSPTHTAPPLIRKLIIMLMINGAYIPES